MEVAVDTVKMAVVGAAGRMGQEVLRTLGKQDGIETVLAIDTAQVGAKVRDLVGPKGPDLTIEDKVGAALDRVKCNVLVDFSHHTAATQHSLSAIKRGVSPVIGTTGMTGQDLREIKAACREAGVPGIYAPNFAIGAVLMMKFAELAARWMPEAEIIELHHDGKEDAPSGTSILTAERIAEARSRTPVPKPAHFKIEGVRGGLCHEVPIHSVRLPGLVAHQMVIFGGKGEALTIKHDSLDRKSFMEGVKLCVLEVAKLDGFVIGMDRILFGH